jgi:predicted RNA binding protein YcfA (HicA-like mRNA interferase family)
VPSIPGVDHQAAIRAFQRAGYEIARQGSHVVMKGHGRTLVIPRRNPINAYTLGGIVQTAGMSVDEFRALL